MFSINANVDHNPKFSSLSWPENTLHSASESFLLPKIETSLEYYQLWVPIWTIAFPDKPCQLLLSLVGCCKKKIHNFIAAELENQDTKILLNFLLLFPPEPGEPKHATPQQTEMDFHSCFGPPLTHSIAEIFPTASRRQMRESFLAEKTFFYTILLQLKLHLLARK